MEAFLGIAGRAQWRGVLHGDRLAVLLNPTAPEDLDKIAAALGVEGRASPGSPLPGEIMVNGVKVNVSNTSRGLELSITDNEKPFDVTQAAVESARSVEIYLDRVAGKVIDPPQDDKYCVCPK